MTPTNPTAHALDPGAIAPPSASVPATSDLLAEPTFEECIEHHSRYSDDCKANRLDFRGVPEGHYIAYYDGRIHDHDADAEALLKRVAVRLKVHPARVFIHYPWMW